ncbi:MAG: 3-hydroxyacyl-ACP dehydratase FabZ [Elusimicrobiota bacterium]
MEKQNKILNALDILKSIPHRYPFLLVDRVEILEEKKSAKGIKCVSANELFFHGHFPERPIMPGVLILESMAQTAAALMSTDPMLSGKFAFFAGVNKAKFRKQVIPGDVMEIFITVDKIKGKIAKVSGVCKVKNDVVCEADLLFAVD